MKSTMKKYIAPDIIEIVLSDELCLNTISNEIADEQPAGSKWRRVIVYDYDYSQDDEFEDEIDEL